MPPLGGGRRLGTKIFRSIINLNASKLRGSTGAFVETTTTLFVAADVETAAVTFVDATEFVAGTVFVVASDATAFVESAARRLTFAANVKRNMDSKSLIPRGVG